ncbi:DUF4174 domain-containing protein [Marinomonas ostreistagni]|uniref:DUF4174 domain-containing protein n=1 Tax=Marinomonas ostreistagni TaxID=359209 RepID=A0ABS0ZEK1_9GAMM|nr:DUF4174 domain-containing protein [Marinomonas ostreistagni]MBJ7552102.1 DUF4174 domain-containing protein [Marinomonas ostreistagni]
MKRYLLPCALAVAALTQTAYASNGELTHLKDLIWQNRIIVANSEQSSDTLTELFSQENSGIIDRDVIWFVFSDNEVQTNYQGSVSPSLLSQVKSQYQLRDNEVILIGKDGGLKERLSGLDLDRLFGDIDRMPMRVREMRE